jgi:hypothetical protein
MVKWVFFPKSTAPPDTIVDTVRVFRSVEKVIDSTKYDYVSNTTLRKVSKGLTEIGYEVETGKKREEKICVPVLFGENGRVEKAFNVDAWHRERKIVLEVEAGRAVSNNQFLKDLFEGCMMYDVDYLAVAVRNVYKRNRDFAVVTGFFETLYVSDRMQLPLKGILIIGY